MYMGWTFLLIYTVTLKWKKKKSHLTLRAPVTVLLTVPRSQVASSIYLIPDPPSYISSYDIQICDKSITGNGVREEACWWPRISPHLYTVKNRINDQRCYIAIIYSQFECLILLQKTNFKAHSQKIFKIITCVCLIVVLFWFHLFIIIFFGFIWIITLNCQSVRAWGGVFMEQKYRRKHPQNNLLKINIHRIVHSYFKFNIHKYCNVIKCGGECICFGKTLGKITSYWFCAFLITITMAKFSCSVLSTLHWRQFTRGIQNIYICCIYTQGVSLFLRHNLKSRASSIIN